MSKYYTTRCYLGWDQNTPSPVLVSNGSLSSAVHPNPGAWSRKGPGADLADQGALHGTEVLAIGGSREDMASVLPVIADDALMLEIARHVETMLREQTRVETRKRIRLANALAADIVRALYSHAVEVQQ